MTNNTSTLRPHHSLQIGEFAQLHQKDRLIDVIVIKLAFYEESRPNGLAAQSGAAAASRVHLHVYSDITPLTLSTAGELSGGDS